MKKIRIETTSKKLLADIYTPVGIYLRLRDRFRDTILLESTDFHAGENSYSYIGINAIAGIEISNTKIIEYKLPGEVPEKITIANPTDVPQHLWDFMQRFEVTEHAPKPINVAQGLFGYSTYDAVQFFDTINLSVEHKEQSTEIPLMRYRLYQYVIAINHFKDELFICENLIPGIESRIDEVESLIKSKDVPVFPFESIGEETSNLTDEQYLQIVKKGIASCYRGDVFQIVLSRKFEQKFRGDEFNVYRALRNINPSPYLFYFDYGDYKLIGSSPESQLIVENGKAIVHPIAGTFKRTGNDEQDKALAIELEADEKENAEHVMLVDLARNDLSRMCNEVEVTQYKKINYYSHVIHLVSEVKGTVQAETNPFKLLAVSFPAGTLSGAPKFKAMQLINEFEPTKRSYYGGAIGFMGFDGRCNHAIMIRTFLSKNNTLIRQAGAGIVAASKPESELQEVNNKLNALKQAIALAQTI
ncbi:anthranilate synthase component I family protein [Ferruginibacter lapsinanis]|uniref:anthranilate synthase component I family protein n=1 Tax=Ferruginibacter lapsinanis TaxID=563172 RepID=UPI001E3A14D4|nr:anthranilate synthase component I family protein [Ferruginibacter lapsinanis]UEG49337.1 anthranilate synthase component I family protein [Ferruginibacter lapsinanis]